MVAAVGGPTFVGAGGGQSKIDVHCIDETDVLREIHWVIIVYRVDRSIRPGEDIPLKSPLCVSVECDCARSNAAAKHSVRARRTKIVAHDEVRVRFVERIAEIQKLSAGKIAGIVLNCYRVGSAGRCIKDLDQPAADLVPVIL